MHLCPTLQYFDPEVFPASYRHGCELWQRGVEGLGEGVVSRHFSHPLEEAGGQPLVCQSVWLGHPKARNVVVLIAGTHGVEGFTGTAVQCDLFNLFNARAFVLPAGVALLCINALNPWGYLHCRRSDHQGIDVNRNFVDFSRPPPANPGYERLRDIFRIADTAQRTRALARMAAHMGQREYEIAFSGGQYVDPAGPFYGGERPSFSRQVIEALICEYNLAERRLAVVDVHTGLGPYGYGEVICDHPPASPGVKTARHWYGPGCALPAEGTSCSVPKLGLLDYAWHAIMGDNSCFVTLEFGTFGTDALFDVLLAEAVAWAEEDTSARVTVARAMREHFYPHDHYWREAVLLRSRQVIQQALSGMMES